MVAINIRALIGQLTYDVNGRSRLEIERVKTLMHRLVYMSVLQECLIPSHNTW